MCMWHSIGRLWGLAIDQGRYNRRFVWHRRRWLSRWGIEYRWFRLHTDRPSRRGLLHIPGIVAHRTCRTLFEWACGWGRWSRLPRHRWRVYNFARLGPNLVWYYRSTSRYQSCNFHRLGMLYPRIYPRPGRFHTWFRYSRLNNHRLLSSGSRSREFRSSTVPSHTVSHSNYLNKYTSPPNMSHGLHSSHFHIYLRPGQFDTWFRYSRPNNHRLLSSGSKSRGSRSSREPSHTASHSNYPNRYTSPPNMSHGPRSSRFHIYPRPERFDRSFRCSRPNNHRLLSSGSKSRGSRSSKGPSHTVSHSNYPNRYTSRPNMSHGLRSSRFHIYPPVSPGICTM